MMDKRLSMGLHGDRVVGTFASQQEDSDSNPRWDPSVEFACSLRASVGFPFILQSKDILHGLIDYSKLPISVTVIRDYLMNWNGMPAELTSTSWNTCGMSLGTKNQTS